MASPGVMRGERTLVRWLIVLLVLFRIVFLVVVYLLASLLGALTFPEIQVSSAYASDPMRAIASFLLPISAMMTAVVVGLRMRRIRPVLHTPAQWVVWWAQLVGLVFLTLGLFGVGAVAKSVNQTAFYIFAVFWYLGTIIQTACSTILNWMVQLVQPAWLHTLRILLTLLMLTAGLLLAVSIAWLFLVAAVAEIVMALATVANFATYAHESEFPHRSKCPFAHPPDVPPICVSE